MNSALPLLTNQDDFKIQHYQFVMLISAFFAYSEKSQKKSNAVFL